MTDSPAPRAHPPGWYADPMGSPRQRWWDGSRWTDDLHDPTLEVYGVAAPAVLGANTPVYNPLIWTIALLPLLTLMASSAIDLTAEVRMTLEETAVPASPEQVRSNLISLGVYAGSVVLAYFDRRRLMQLGIAKPFHFAWSFLWVGVYVFGRSVVVRRAVGRGMTPAYVWLAIFVLSLIVVVSRMTDAVNTVFPNGTIPT